MKSDYSQLITHYYLLADKNLCVECYLHEVNVVHYFVSSDSRYQR